MENKGFTLIELLVVVAILGALGAIISVSLSNTLSNSNQEGCDRFVKEVEDAACVYASLSTKEVVCDRNNCAPIPLSYLIKEGLIKSEKDSCTNRSIEELANETVSISWTNDGEKKCVYNGVKTYGR